jgi:hypothetical protein
MLIVNAQYYIFPAMRTFVAAGHDMLCARMFVARVTTLSLRIISPDFHTIFSFLK